MLEQLKNVSTLYFIRCGEQVYNYYKKLCQECNLKDFSEDGVYDGPPLKKSKHSL